MAAQMNSMRRKGGNARRAVSRVMTTLTTLCAFLGVAILVLILVINVSVRLLTRKKF